MAKEIPETAAHSNWSLESEIRKKFTRRRGQSAIKTWLRSFPTVRLRLKHSDDDLQRMSEWDRF